jgi:hypothetical protein
VNAFSDGIDFNVYQKYLKDKWVANGEDMKFFKELYDNIKQANK